MEEQTLPMSNREIICAAERAHQAFTALEYHQGCVAKMVARMNDSNSSHDEAALLAQIETGLACMKDGEAIAEDIYQQYLHCTFGSTRCFDTIDGCTIRKVLVRVMNEKTRAGLLQSYLCMVQESVPAFVAGLSLLHSMPVDFECLQYMPEFDVMMFIHLNEWIAGYLVLTSPADIDAVYSGDMDQIKQVIAKCGDSEAQHLLHYLPSNALAFINDLNSVDIRAKRRRQ